MGYVEERRFLVVYIDNVYEDFCQITSCLSTSVLHHYDERMLAVLFTVESLQSVYHSRATVDTELVLTRRTSDRIDAVEQLLVLILVGRTDLYHFGHDSWVLGDTGDE